VFIFESNPWSGVEPTYTGYSWEDRKQKKEFAARLDKDISTLVEKIKNNQAIEEDVLAYFSKYRNDFSEKPFTNSELIYITLKGSAMFSWEEKKLVLKFVISDRKARGAPLEINGRAPDERDYVYGENALLYLASCDFPHSFTRILINNGADVNIQDYKGNTPLNIWVRSIRGWINSYHSSPIENEQQLFRGYLKFPQLILRHGADPSIPNLKGETPLSVANHFEKVSLVDGVTTHKLVVNYAIDAVQSLLNQTARYGKMLLLPLIFCSALSFATPSYPQAKKENPKNMEYFSNLRKNKPCFRDFVKTSRLRQKTSGMPAAHLPGKRQPAILH